MKSTTLFKTKLVLLTVITICIFLGMFVADAFYIPSSLLAMLLFFIFLMPIWSAGQMTRLESFEKGAQNNK